VLLAGPYERQADAPAAMLEANRVARVFCMPVSLDEATGQRVVDATIADPKGQGPGLYVAFIICNTNDYGKCSSPSISSR
jgi:hypothetical protein